VANVTALLQGGGGGGGGGQRQQLLCFVDVSVAEQVAAFVQVFAGRFTFIDGHGGHCPHFDMATLNGLLMSGGIAANIFEMSESVMTAAELKYWLEAGHFKKFFGPNFMTSRIYDWSGFDRTVAEPEFAAAFRAKIRALTARPDAHIELGDAGLTLDTMGLHELQRIMRCMMFDVDIPLGMRGSFVMMQKTWWSSVRLEFIDTKTNVDYKTSAIDAYQARMGNDDVIKRARFIMAAIEEDVRHGAAWASKAKYKTFCNHVLTKMVV